MPEFFIIETRDPLIPWQIHSGAMNENADFRAQGCKPDRYIAGFRTRKAAEAYFSICC